MICPHCGKETGEAITINAAVPNLNNGCNPIIPTFQTFEWNTNAAAGCGTVMLSPLTTVCAAPVPVNVQQITLKFP